MQAKVFEFFAQGKAGQAQPARGFGLVAFGKGDCLRNDFAFGFGQHASMSVLQKELLSKALSGLLVPDRKRPLSATC